MWLAGNSMRTAPIPMTDPKGNAKYGYIWEHLPSIYPSFVSIYIHLPSIYCRFVSINTTIPYIRIRHGNIYIHLPSIYCRFVSINLPLTYIHGSVLGFCLEFRDFPARRKPLGFPIATWMIGAFRVFDSVQLHRKKPDEDVQQPHTSPPNAEALKSIVFGFKPYKKYQKTLCLAMLQAWFFLRTNLGLALCDLLQVPRELSPQDVLFLMLPAISNQEYSGFFYGCDAVKVFRFSNLRSVGQSIRLCQTSEFL